MACRAGQRRADLPLLIGVARWLSASTAERAVEYTIMRKHRESRMASSPVKRKSAMDELLDTMKGVIEDGARGMTPKERKESEKKFNAALDRAVAARKRRRETA